MRISHSDQPNNEVRTDGSNPWGMLSAALVGWGWMLGLVVVGSISKDIMGDIVGTIIIAACLIGAVVLSFRTFQSHLRGLRRCAKEVESDEHFTRGMLMFMFHFVGIVLLQLPVPIALVGSFI